MQLGEMVAVPKDAEGIGPLPVSTQVSTVAAVAVDGIAVEAIQAVVMTAPVEKSYE